MPSTTQPPHQPPNHRFGGKSVLALEKMRGEIQARLDKGEETGLDVDYWENVLAELQARLCIYTHIYVHV